MFGAGKQMDAAADRLPVGVFWMKPKNCLWLLAAESFCPYLNQPEVEKLAADGLWSLSLLEQCGRVLGQSHRNSRVQRRLLKNEVFCVIIGEALRNPAGIRGGGMFVGAFTHFASVFEDLLSSFCGFRLAGNLWIQSFVFHLLQQKAEFLSNYFSFRNLVLG